MSDILAKITIFSEDEKNFVRGICLRFPKIEQSFNDFFDSSDRVRDAQKKLYSIQRAGWKRIGIADEYVQNDGDHVDDCVELVPFVVPADMVIPVQVMMRRHELGEGIIGDFTPFDDITSDEKSRLETLAVRFLTEKDKQGPSILSDFVEFEECSRYVGKVSKDIDRLEMVLQARVYEHLFPDMTEKLVPFWDYTEKKLSTKEGKDFFYATKSDITIHPIKQDWITHTPQGLSPKR